MDDIRVDLTEDRSSNIIQLQKRALSIASSSSTAPKGFNGPLSGPMWLKANQIPSAYPDSFDYGMYDRLFSKFGDQQPRGGVVYNTNFKLLNYQPTCSQCHYTFELDTYGRGCVHNCTYCYAKDQLSPYGYWNKPHPFPLDISEIRRIFATVFESDRPHRWRDILTRRIPIRIGSMSDAFMWMDAKYRVTHELLKILSFYDYPYIIFTRSDLVSHDDYLSVLRRDLASVQFSISGNNEELTRKLEPGAPSVDRRVKALSKLGNAGIWTTVRINPLFPTYPDGYFTDLESLNRRFSTRPIPKLSLLDIEDTKAFAEQLSDSKVPSVLAGFVRLSLRAINALTTATDLDIRSFFKPQYLTAPGEKRYSDSEIAYYYTILRDTFSKKGIRFSTCYIGNGEKDYFQYQALWANKSDCCDARSNVSGFKSSCQDLTWKERISFADPNKLRALEERQKKQRSRPSEPESAPLEVTPGLTVQPVNGVQGESKELT